MPVAITITDNSDGATVALAVSGLGVSESFQLSRAPFTGVFSSFSFANVSSGSGNGSFSVATPPGQYVWMLTGATSGISNIVYQGVEDIAPPIHKRIVSAVNSRIVSLNLPWLPSNKVLSRWLPKEFRQGEGSPPLCYVCPLGVETQNDKVMGQDDPGYPVTCVLVMASNADASAGTLMDEVLSWRTRVSRAFRNQRLPGVPIVYNCIVNYDSIADPGAFLKNYLVSVVNLRFFAREIRGLGTNPTP